MLVGYRASVSMYLAAFRQLADGCLVEFLLNGYILHFDEPFEIDCIFLLLAFGRVQVFFMSDVYYCVTFIYIAIKESTVFLSCHHFHFQ